MSRNRSRSPPRPYRDLRLRMTSPEPMLQRLPDSRTRARYRSGHDEEFDDRSGPHNGKLPRHPRIPRPRSPKARDPPRYRWEVLETQHYVAMVHANCKECKAFGKHIHKVMPSSGPPGCDDGNPLFPKLIAATAREMKGYYDTFKTFVANQFYLSRHNPPPNPDRDSRFLFVDPSGSVKQVFLTRFGNTPPREPDSPLEEVPIPAGQPLPYYGTDRYRPPDGKPLRRYDPMQSVGNHAWSLVHTDGIGRRLPSPICIVGGSRFQEASDFFEVTDPNWRSYHSLGDIERFGQAACNTDPGLRTDIMKEAAAAYIRSLAPTRYSFELLPPTDLPERLWILASTWVRSQSGVPHHIGVSNNGRFDRTDFLIAAWVAEMCGNDLLVRLHILLSLFCRKATGILYMQELITDPFPVHPRAHLPFYLRVDDVIEYSPFPEDLDLESHARQFYTELRTLGGFDPAETHVVHAIADWADRYTDGPSNEYYQHHRPCPSIARAFESPYLQVAPWVSPTYRPHHPFIFNPFVFNTILIGDVVPNPVDEAIEIPSVLVGPSEGSPTHGLQAHSIVYSSEPYLPSAVELGDLFADDPDETNSTSFMGQDYEHHLEDAVGSLPAVKGYLYGPSFVFHRPPSDIWVTESHVPHFGLTEFGRSHYSLLKGPSFGSFYLRPIAASTPSPEELVGAWNPSNAFFLG